MKEKIIPGFIIFVICLGLLIAMLTITITTPKHSSPSSSTSSTQDITEMRDFSEPYDDKLAEMQHVFDNIDLSRFKRNNNIK